MILLLIALFTAISGKPLDGVFMLVVATGLAWDAARRARSRPPAPAGGDPAVPAPAAQAAAAEARAAEAAAARGRPRRPLLIVTGLAVGALYAALVGSFARYSWPATAAVLGLGAIVLAVGWRESRRWRPVPGKLPMPGAMLWGGLLVAGGLWELAALLQQPSLTVASYTHPTVSSLTDPLLGTHAGRSLALATWLALGWFLVER